MTSNAGTDLPLAQTWLDAPVGGAVACVLWGQAATWCSHRAANAGPFPLHAWATSPGLSWVRTRISMECASFP